MGATARHSMAPGQRETVTSVTTKTKVHFQLKLNLDSAGDDKESIMPDCCLSILVEASRLGQTITAAAAPRSDDRGVDEDAATGATDLARSKVIS